MHKWIKQMFAGLLQMSTKRFSAILIKCEPDLEVKFFNFCHDLMQFNSNTKKNTS